MSVRVEEEFLPLLLPTEPDDSDKNHIEKCLWNAIEAWLKSGQTAIIALNKLKGRVEKSYYHSRIARFGGIICVIVSSILLIVGFGLSYPGTGTQYNGSIGQYIAGSVLVVLGAITICGAEIGYTVIAMTALSNADVVRQIDQELVDTINKLKVLYQKLSGSDNKYNTYSMVQCIMITQKGVKKTSQNCLFMKPLARAIFCCCHLLASIADITLSTLVSVLAFAPSSSIQSASGQVQFEVVVQAISIGAIVYNAILIHINLAVMIKSLCDIFWYKKRRVSMSTAASMITSLINELKEQNHQLMKNFEKR